MTLTAKVVTEFAELAALAPEWDRLLAVHPRPQVFHTWPWQLATWRAHGERRSLCTAVVREGDRVVGILPLARERGEVRFLAMPDADYCDLICEPSRAGAVLTAALEALHAHGVRRVFFQHVPPDALLVQAHAALAARWAGRFVALPGDPCPTLLAPSPADYEPILAKQSLRRHEKALAKRGALRFERITDREAIRALLSEFFAQHATRRACSGDRSNLSDPRSRVFYEALLDLLDPATQLHFVRLLCGNTTVAFHLGFVCDGRFTWYKPTIHVDYWDEGPGEVLLKKLMEAARDQGLVEFDFTRGDESFKRRFANHDRPNRHLLLVAPGVAGAVERARLALAAAIRGRPRLHALGKFLLEQALGLRSALRRHGVPGVARRIVRMLQQCVYRRDTVLVFCRSARQSPAALDALGLRLHEGRLSDLASCAAQDPEHFDARRMRNARHQLKQGDRLLLARRGDQVVHVAWLGTRTEIVASSEVGTGVSMPLPGPVTVVYDTWTPEACRGQGIYTAVLENLQPLAPGQELWIYCSASNEGSVRGIRKAGFVPAGTMERRVWLRRCTRAWRTSQPSR